MQIKRFKNGNFTLKAEPEDYDREGVFIHALWALGDKDCNVFGEEYCLSNYDMAIDLYDYYMDRLLRFPYSVADDLKHGKRIRLYSRKLNKYDREEYKRLEERGEL